MESILELQQKLNKIRDDLPIDQQRLFNLKSIQNFLLYFDKLSSSKSEAMKLLQKYFKMMESYDYHIDKDISKMITETYITPLGVYYHKDVGFKIKLEISDVIIYSIGGDLLLLIFGLIKKPEYLLIVPAFILSYFFT
ncbi:MAG: hypothetical protein KGM16_00710 [Bacteroidota bacterium]|nr:hypothetical protein [Bacteroidota bacterium]